MNWRKPVYLGYATLRGYRFPEFLAQYSQMHKREGGREIIVQSLANLLRHCRESVPYYAERLQQVKAHAEPTECLIQLPVLTKEIIRSNFDRLKSADLHRRKWIYNTSGGSTGEPIRLIQDREYEDRCKATGLFCETLWDCELGRPRVRLWGSERDFEMNNQNGKARFFNWLTNTVWLNAFNMSVQRMSEFIRQLDRFGPTLIVAYAQAAYELAQFAERERLSLAPQRAVVTSAGTLYPFMREKIAQVFGCPVYNLYGSREVSLIGCEIPDTDGLWVPPWSNYVEILDDNGNPVASGEEGNIVVTCLTNFAMPLVRYQIGDRGALTSDHSTNGGPQTLKFVSGRNVDMFRTRDRKLVDGEYFTHLLYFRPWVGKFQVVQRDFDHVLFKIVKLNGGPSKTELEEITAKSRLAMGDGCRIDFEFHNELPSHASGKYRYTISEVGQ